jgi:L-amino acid N-acyltransferase YncA
LSINEHNIETRPLLMVENDRNPVGWASFQSFYGRPAYDATVEISIYLDQEFRGRGYGKLILTHCIEIAGGMRINTLIGFIFEHNKPSLKLFSAAGFQEWEHLPGIAVIDNHEYGLKILGKKIQ